MHFGFALDSLDMDLQNIDLLDAHLDLLDTDTPASPRRLDMSKTCLQDDFKACLQDVFNVTIFRLPRCLQDFFKTSCEMS